jgi:hypothetical protein
MLKPILLPPKPVRAKPSFWNTSCQNNMISTYKYNHKLHTYVRGPAWIILIHLTNIIKNYHVTMNVIVASSIISIMQETLHKEKTIACTRHSLLSYKLDTQHHYTLTNPATSLSCVQFSLSCVKKIYIHDLLAVCSFLAHVSLPSLWHHHTLQVIVAKAHDNYSRSHRVFHHQPLYMTSSTPPDWKQQSSVQVASLPNIWLSSNA